jgi:hypothetical protein
VSVDHDPLPAARGLADEPDAGSAARKAAGWQRRFVVDSSRMVEMVRLYQSLGYETAVDPIGPEDLPPDPPGDQTADALVSPDPRCGECRLVTLRWLHVIYTRAARTPRGE